MRQVCAAPKRAARHSNRCKISPSAPSCYSLTRMRFLIAISLFLTFAGSLAVAQNTTEAASTSPPQSSATSSPLNGNWNLTGNRKKEQFPLLSMFLQVNGKQILAGGDYQAVCPDSPRDGSGGRGGGLRGDIAPDGSFTIRNSPQSTIQVEISGHVPTEGATAWSGQYTLAGDLSRKCPAYRQINSFTATLFAPLNGTFSGTLAMQYFESPPPAYTGPLTSQAKFSIIVTQGAVVAQRLNTGDIHFHFPLTGTIRVKGSSCFSHGSADPLTYGTHASGPSPYSTLQGDVVTLRFAMNDESQLNLHAVFADPGESALVVTDARVVGGECDKQSFHGTLDVDHR